MLVVGCGALGTVSAELLGRAGVGRLVLVDRDVVEHTNLQRQVLFDEADADASAPKAEAARRRLAAINSPTSTSTRTPSDLDHRNAEALAGIGPDAIGPRVDVVVDGTDNFATRFPAQRPLLQARPAVLLRRCGGDDRLGDVHPAPHRRPRRPVGTPRR